MESKTFGRLRLEKHNKWSSIIEKPTLEDSFETTPKKVKHVGDHKYIEKKWAELIKDPQYKQDPKSIF